MVSPVNLFKSSSLFTNLSQNKKASAENHAAGPGEGASDTDANVASSPTPSFSAQGDAAARTFSDPNNAQTSPFFLNLNVDSPTAMLSMSVDVAAQRLDGALVERDAAPSAISHYYDGAVNSARENLNTAVTTEIVNGDPALSPEERGDVIIGRFEQDSRVRNEVQRTVGQVLAQTETDEQGSEPDRPEFLDTLPDMNGRRALEIINENFDLVDAADADGEINGTAAKNDLEQIANSDSDEYSEELIAASQYLLDNPEFYGMMEVVREDRKIEVQEGEQSEIDGKFTQEEVQVFLQGQEHMKVILSNTDEIDVSQTGGNPDGLLSENDFNEVTSKKDENGNFVYSRELREAAQFMLDNDRFYDLVDAAAVRGSRPEIGNTSGENNFNSPDGDISSQDLYLSALQMQVFGDDPAAAREFLLNTDQDIIDNFNISDENSIPDEGLRATTAAAMRDVESMDDVIDLVLVLPETNRAFRNELITAVYADLGVEFDDF